MSQNTPKIAVVILNWNGKLFLEKFLQNVVINSAPHRVILADNASTDNSVDFVRSNFPDVEIIVNNENGGFARGYNEALKHVDANYYVLLNSDVEVSPNWLEPLIEVMSDSSVAGCQPKIKSHLNRTVFEHAGAAGGYLDKDFFPFCRGRIFDFIEEDTGQYNDTTEVFWATGACMMIRADLYHKVNGLDEDFFAHMEEIDLCWRLKKLGYKFMAVGKSEVFHVGGGTLDYLSPRKTFLNFRNSLFMITKNYDGWRTVKLTWRLYLDGLAGMRFLIRGDFKHVGAVFNSHVEFYRYLGKMKRKRKAFYSTHELKPNTFGIYKKSILKKYFFEGVKKFNNLNRRDFD